MNCKQIQTQLDDYLDSELTVQQRSQIEAHLQTCADCAREYEDARQIRQMLVNLPVEAPAPGFEQRLFDRVRNRYPQQAGQHRFKAGFATAIAAGLALWFAATVFIPQTQGPALDVVTIGLQESRDLKLVFTSLEAIQQASLEIELPENIELLGYPGKKVLAWKTPLDKGQNLLTLPVQALGKVEGELVARVDYGNKQKIYRLKLKTSNGGALNSLQLDYPAA